MQPGPTFNSLEVTWICVLPGYPLNFPEMEAFVWDEATRLCGYNISFIGSSEHTHPLDI